MGRNLVHSIIVLGNRGFIGNVIFHKLRKHYGKNILGISSRKLDLTRTRSISKLSLYCSDKTVLVVVSGIRAERDDSLNAFRHNIAMMVHLALAIAKQPLRQCIYLSTVSIYGGGPKEGAITEKSPLALDSLYAIAKYAGEKLLEKICASNGTPLLILRLPRVYGPGDAYAQYGPSAFVQEIVKEGKVVLYGDGGEAREFLYIEDLGEIVDLSISRATTGLLNVASGISHTFLETVEILKRTIAKPFVIRHLARTGQKYDEYYDNTRFRILFPDYSFTSLEKGLLSTLNQSQNNFSARLQG